MPGDFQPPPIGTRDDVIRHITKALPEVNFDDPSWGHLQGPDFSVELNIGSGDTIDSLMLHVRGGDGALAIIQLLTDALGVRAVDCSEGEFLNLSTPDALASLQAWRAYRDCVI